MFYLRISHSSAHIDVVFQALYGVLNLNSDDYVPDFNDSC